MNPRSSHFLRQNQKILGILGFLLLLSFITALIEPRFSGAGNIANLVRYTGLYGLISLGVAFVIITGGIDLSIGSLIGLTGVLLPRLIVPEELGWPLPVAIAFIIGISLLAGLVHGLLITGLRLQPFLVTLCGLFIYRGIARGIGGDRSLGFGTDFQALRDVLVKHQILPMIPMSFVVLVLIAIVASVFLNRTVYGRYLLALGENEEAARFSGVSTARMKICAYMISSGLAGFAGIMFVLDNNSASGSSFGSFYELYAIAGAVLGGCSLRGGEGTVVGVILGAALVQIIENAVFFLGVPDTIKFAVLGSFILIGVIVDELLNRMNARRRALEGGT